MTFQPLELFVMSVFVTILLLVLTTVFEDFRIALVAITTVNIVCFFIGAQASMEFGVWLICFGFIQQILKATRKWAMASIAIGFGVAVISYFFMQK